MKKDRALKKKKNSNKTKVTFWAGNGCLKLRLTFRAGTTEKLTECS